MLWTALAFLLSAPPYGYGNAVIGLFGLAGVAGVLAANLAGRMADAERSGTATIAAAALLAASYGLLALGRDWVVALLAGIVVLDLGTQGMQITNQAVIYALRPDARSRINSAYMVCYFVGGAWVRSPPVRCSPPRAGTACASWVSASAASPCSAPVGTGSARPGAAPRRQPSALERSASARAVRGAGPARTVPSAAQATVKIRVETAAPAELTTRTRPGSPRGGYGPRRPGPRARHGARLSVGTASNRERTA